MFGLIRLGIWCIVLSLVLKYRPYINSKLKRVITVTAYILLFIVSFLLPIENLFFTFSAPESAFNYTNSDDIELVIDGKETSMVVTSDSTIVILPKADDGWKLGMGYEIKTVYRSVDNGFLVSLLRYKETNEYYIITSGISKQISKIEDNKDSTFSYREDLNTCYAYIGNYDKSYRLTII